MSTTPEKIVYRRGESFAWTNGTNTPLNAENLNYIEKGIRDIIQVLEDNVINEIYNNSAEDTLVSKINKLDTDITNLESNMVEKGSYVSKENDGILSKEQYKQLQDDIQAAASSGGDPVSVVNNLTSDSTTAALAAAQGKNLNNKIAELKSNLENQISGIVTGEGLGDMLKSEYVTNNPENTNKVDRALFSDKAETLTELNNSTLQTFVDERIKNQVGNISESEIAAILSALEWKSF